MIVSAIVDFYNAIGKNLLNAILDYFHKLGYQKINVSDNVDLKMLSDLGLDGVVFNEKESKIANNRANPL
ncbi:MAG: hypothetical protein GY829_12115 [Gammaproteobacteria bacterium]|nr:hypothetical protein [Gammaproteobacteria bacterium]